MRPIPDYENEYLISETGEVTRRETGRVIRPSLNPQKWLSLRRAVERQQGQDLLSSQACSEDFHPQSRSKAFC